MRERKPLGLTIEREQRGERLVSRWLSLEIRSLADLMTSVQYLDRKIKGQRPKGATDELRRPHALLLNELGNWRTRKTRQRNRLTLAKQGPVTWPLSWSTRASEDRRCTALCAARRARRARASPPGEAEETRSVCWSGVTCRAVSSVETSVTDTIRGLVTGYVMTYRCCGFDAGSDLLAGPTGRPQDGMSKRYP